MNLGRSRRQYIVLGYNEYNSESHNWYITDNLQEALSLKSKWETRFLQVQIRWIGDVVNNPLANEADRIDLG
ncbi:MAG: hypothetical protein HOF71_05310 [Chloroflexi bacterium]|jgi:hypothetical protein|nr:hypothetical protein [Chloroflexota bacterium]